MATTLTIIASLNGAPAVEMVVTHKLLAQLEVHPACSIVSVEGIAYDEGITLQHGKGLVALA